MDPQDLVAFVDDQAAQIASRQPDLAFDRDEYAGRLRRLQLAMEQAKLDTLIVSAPDAMCWLHGPSVALVQEPLLSSAWPPFQCTVVHLGDERLLQFDMERHRYLIPRTSVVLATCGSSRSTPSVSGLSSLSASSRPRGGSVGRSGSRSGARCRIAPRAR